VREVGANLYKSSIQVQLEFGKYMLTVITALFPIYFALMKFLGFETVLSADASAQTIFVLAAPPVLLVLAAFLFGLTVLPLRADIGLDDLTSINNARQLLLRRRYWFIVTGMIAYSAALGGAIVAAILALMA